MYITDFVCTYNILEDDILYQIQFLQAFDLKEWDGNKIDEGLNEIQEKCMKYSKFTNVITKLGGGELGFLLLFSYDYFNFTHSCICDMLTKQSIDEGHYNALLEKIDKNNK